MAASTAHLCRKRRQRDLIWVNGRTNRVANRTAKAGLVTEERFPSQELDGQFNRIEETVGSVGIAQEEVTTDALDIAVERGPLEGRF
jgi:hypothetical protein